MTDFVLSESSRDYKKIQKGRESIGEILDEKNMEYIELQKECNSIKEHIAEHEKEIQLAEFTITNARESILQLEEDYKIKNTILLAKKEWMEGIEMVLHKSGGRVGSASSSTVNVNSPVNSSKKPFVPTSRISSVGKKPKKTLATTVTRSPGRKRKEPPVDSTPSTPITPTRSRSRQTTPNKRQKKNETMEPNSQTSYSKVEINIKGKPQTVLKDSRGRFTKKEKLVEKPDKNEEEEVDEEGNEEDEDEEEEEEEDQEEQEDQEDQEDEYEEEQEEDDDSIVQKKNIRRKKK